jgi:parallel beta-helix repeat protein
MTNCKRVPLVIAVTLAAMFGTLLLMESLASIVLASPDDLFASDTGSGTACTQGSPCDLQTALGQATDGDTIYVAGGTYTDTTGAVVDVTKSITLYGGWDGTTTAPVVRDPDTYPTTLDGEGSRRAVRINGNYTVTLDGLELFNGSGGTDGGGLYVRNARVVVSGCQIYSNTAQYGGGVYLEYSDDAVLMGNQVFLNWSTTRGGGIYSGDSLTATLTGNDIYSNTCTSGSEAGGGVFVAYGHGTSLVENDIFHNTAPSGYGGGVHFYHSDNVVLTDNSFYGNEADDNGGGIYLNNSHTATLSYNDVFSNAASYGGGVHVQASDNVTLTENAIYSNTANQYYGGGVYLEDSDGVRLDGNDILSNTAVFRGGGVCLEDSDNVTLTSNTIVSNTAAWGGGVCLFPDTDSSSASLSRSKFHNLGAAGATISRTQP